MTFLSVCCKNKYTVGADQEAVEEALQNVIEFEIQLANVNILFYQSFCIDYLVDKRQRWH
jgi:hypothetical protein